MSKPTYKTIVCATDFSAASDVAVEHAAALARTFGATLHVVHVVQDAAQQPWTVEAYTLNLADLTREWVEEARRSLARVAAASGVQPITSCLVGRPAHEILQYLRDTAADLLVVGSHGHGAFAQLLLGSVAERLVRQAGCPVLVARAPAAATSHARLGTSAHDAQPAASAYAPEA